MSSKCLGNLNGKKVYLYETLEDYFADYKDLGFDGYGVIKKDLSVVQDLYKKGEIDPMLITVTWLDKFISLNREYYKQEGENGEIVVSESDEITRIIEDIRKLGEM